MEGKEGLVRAYGAREIGSGLLSLSLDKHARPVGPGCGGRARHRHRRDRPPAWQSQGRQRATDLGAARGHHCRGRAWGAGGDRAPQAHRRHTDAGHDRSGFPQGEWRKRAGRHETSGRNSRPRRPGSHRSAAEELAPPTYLRKDQAAVGIALISSLGVIGGFVSPTLLGLIRTYTGSLDIGIYVVAAVMVAGAAVTVLGLPSRALRVGAEPAQGVARRPTLRAWLFGCERAGRPSAPESQSKELSQAAPLMALVELVRGLQTSD